MTLPERILAALAAHPNLSATEIATLLEENSRGGITGAMASLTARGAVLRIKRPNENARTAYAYSLAPSPRTRPVQTRALEPVVIEMPQAVPIPKTVHQFDMNTVIACIPQMTIADAKKLRAALNEVFA